MKINFQAWFVAAIGTLLLLQANCSLINTRTYSTPFMPVDITKLRNSQNLNIIRGVNSYANGALNIVDGNNVKIDGNFNTILGDSNRIIKDGNLVNGRSNSIKGNNNKVFGNDAIIVGNNNIVSDSLVDYKLSANNIPPTNVRDINQKITAILDNVNNFNKIQSSKINKIFTVPTSVGNPKFDASALPYYRYKIDSDGKIVEQKIIQPSKPSLETKVIKDQNIILNESKKNNKIQAKQTFLKNWNNASLENVTTKNTIVNLSSANTTQNPSKIQKNIIIVSRQVPNKTYDDQSSKNAPQNLSITVSKKQNIQAANNRLPINDLILLRNALLQALIRQNQARKYAQYLRNLRNTRNPVFNLNLPTFNGKYVLPANNWGPQRSYPYYQNIQNPINQGFNYRNGVSMLSSGNIVIGNNNYAYGNGNVIRGNSNAVKGLYNQINGNTNNLNGNFVSLNGNFLNYPSRQILQRYYQPV